MNKVDVYHLVEQLWSGNQSSRIRALQTTRELIPRELQYYFDGLVDSKISNIEDDVDATVILLVHGIQTDGAWQKLVQAEFRSIAKTNVHALGFEFFNAAQLFSPFRKGPIEKIEREYRDVVAQEPKARIIVIAHSFGTYITSKLLSEYPRIKFDKIIFCGAIVPKDFRWEMHADNLNSTSILNDVGTRDIWPIIATTVSLGYGASGRIGFQTNRVTDRYFNFKHSDFFTQNHIRKYWLPFIKNGKIVSSEWDINKPKSSDIINLFSNSTQAKIVVAITIFLLILTYKYSQSIIDFIFGFF